MRAPARSRKATAEAQLSAAQRRLAKTWLLDRSQWVVPFDWLKQLAQRNPRDDGVQFAYRTALNKRQRVMAMGDEELVTALQAQIEVLAAVQASGAEDEKALAVGRKILLGTARGTSKAHGSPELRAVRYAEMQAAVDHMHTQNPSLTHTAISERLSVRFNTTGRTIRVHTTDPRKK